jgi:hypothetical protein
VDTLHTDIRNDEYSLPTAHYTATSSFHESAIHSDDLASANYNANRTGCTERAEPPKWRLEYLDDGDVRIRYDLPRDSDIPTTPQICQPRPTSTDGFKILQWNVNGYHTRTGILIRDLRLHDFSAALIQEASKVYEPFTRPNLPGFKVYPDLFGKTAVIVRKDLKCSEIPLKLLNDADSVKDTTYASAVVVRLLRRGKITDVLLMSIYRSPQNKSALTHVQKYLQQCRHWLTQHGRKVQLRDWIIGGDFNASHTAWGAKRGTTSSKRAGRRLKRFLDDTAGWSMLNSRHSPPTWVFHDQTARKTTHSWLDITLCSQRLAASATWHVEQIHKQSDHYQIHITIPADWRPPDLCLDEMQETMWKLRDDPVVWAAFTTDIEQRWLTEQTSLRDMMTDFRRTKQQRIEDISECIEKIYHSAAQSHFGTKVRRSIWKKWIPKRAQFHSIQFHRFYRRFIKKRRKTRNDWRIFEALRKKRDYWLSYYKHRWLEAKFHQAHLRGKDPWRIMNEARDVNDTRGQRIPEIVDGEGNILARTTRDKVELINRYYHRFRDNATLCPSWCWPRPQAMPTRFRYQGDTDPVRQMHRNHEPCRVHREPTVRPVDDQMEDVSHELREQRYKDWIVARNDRRWRRCQGDHEYWLSTLNARITAVEVKRAISSFDNGKAQGPDRMDIQFFKKTGRVSQDIILMLSNLMFKDWQVMPRRWKERWIVPLIKIGKKGDQLKELRPVSLTSYVAKILEKILVHRLSTYVIRLHLLSSVHFAYLRGRSATDCLVYMVDRIQRNMRQRIHTHCIYFDFSSAFDTVQHSILLWKLEHQFFIRGPLLDFLAAFLAGRRSCVKMHGIMSMWMEDKVGVPQGGALSPLLYILYVDDLGVLNQIRGLHVAIFSDDLAIWTSEKHPRRARVSLQEGIYFAQWFCRLNGLIMNHGKTEYKVFKVGRLNDDDLLQLQLRGALEPTRDGTMIQTDDRPIKHNPAPIRYLGYWLDTNLNFKAHADVVRKKVLAGWAPIRRNFQKLWHIKADIIWTLIDSCCMSIFDYSAVLWPMMKKQDQKKWTQLYRRLVKSCFGTVRGTPRIHLYHQLGTYPLQERMALLVSQYYTRMLRAPRTGQLHRLLRHEWWQHLTQCYEPPTVANSRRNTIIWHINAYAKKYDNDDRAFLLRMPGRNIDRIPHNLSHSLDLTHQWQSIQLDPEPFTDADYEERWRGLTSDELLIFTDGSVKYRFGGFGSHVIAAEEYLRTIRCGQDFAFYETLTRGRDLTHIEYTAGDRAYPLSNRCSIDFCESIAIHDAIHALAGHLQQKAADHRSRSPSIPYDLRYSQYTPILADRGIQTIRIVSDNLTVLKWLSGEYEIRHPTQLRLVEEVKWCISTLELDFGVRIIFQWTRSHTDKTLGNDFADARAKEGYHFVDRVRAKRDPEFYDEWSYYHMRGVLNRCRRYFDSKMERDLARSLQQTRFGHQISAEWRRGKAELQKSKDKRHPARAAYDSRYQITAGIPWTDFFKREMQFVSRDVMRIIIGLRTGHNHLNGYMTDLLHVRSDHRCFCGQQGQDLAHLLEDCDDVLLLQRRGELQRYVQGLYREAFGFLKEEDPTRRLHWHPGSYDFYTGLPYLYPPYDMPMSIRGKILRAIADFYRWIVGYQTSRAPVCRNVSTISSHSTTLSDPTGIG